MAQEAQSQGKDARRQRVLIIDDDRTFREVVGHLLRQLNYEVFTAEDGAQGYDAAAKNLPDVILCDVHMKGMHGYATTEAIKENPDLNSIPIVMVTGSASRLGEMRGRNSGADYYLAKPVRASELTEILNTAMKDRAGSTPDDRGGSRSKDFIMG
ncbi:MAG: response regulator [Rhodothermales bacterium]|nr:response regulator [Rhodothermales bacterium]